jgi:hypothetical protein
MSIELFKGIPREDVMAELGQQMRAISEEATCCGWDFRVAEGIPAACYAIVNKNEPGDFMGTPISVPLARWLVAMAKHLGHWVESDGDWVAYTPRAMKSEASRTGHTARERPRAKK